MATTAMRTQKKKTSFDKYNFGKSLHDYENA